MSKNPKSCLVLNRDTYYINRDTLFSFHRASEAFLQRVMALYVSSHYKVRHQTSCTLNVLFTTMGFRTTLKNVLCTSFVEYSQ